MRFKLDIGDAIKMSSIWTYNISAAALARRQGVTVEELLLSKITISFND